jgi:hypothetical protein
MDCSILVSFFRLLSSFPMNVSILVTFFSFSFLSLADQFLVTEGSIPVSFSGFLC